MKKFILTALLAPVLLLGCQPKEGSCNIMSVMLDEDFFPGRVHAEPIDSPIPDAPPESAERIFSVKTDFSTDVIQMDIMNFMSGETASNFWEREEKQIFRTDSYRGQWKTPEKLADLNLAPDQSHLACGVVLSNATCRWLARYQGYYVYLRADTSEHGVSEDVFLNAVKEIDSRMTQCIDD